MSIARDLHVPPQAWPTSVARARSRCCAVHRLALDVPDWHTRGLQKLPVPVNIVTGHLSAGKTTLIVSLLERKPAHEHWAVLVNEFGALGIDAALLQGASSKDLGASITVKQLAGGCMCCALAGPMTAAVAMLLRSCKPDRLLIEASGLGHPAGLVDVLQRSELRTSVVLEAVVCLLDPLQVSTPEWATSDLIRDQLQIADVVAVSKVDLAGAEQLQSARQHIDQLYPPKQQCYEIAHGCLPLEALQLGSSAQAASHVNGVTGTGNSSSANKPALSSELHTTSGNAMMQNAELLEESSADTQAATSTKAGKVAPAQPLRIAKGGASCGWMFDVADVFNEAELLRWLQVVAAHAERVKGVFRLERRHACMHQGPGGTITLQSIAYRRDSRIEIIAQQAQGEDATFKGAVCADATPEATSVVHALQSFDWDTIEKGLVACLQSSV